MEGQEPENVAGVVLPACGAITDIDRVGVKVGYHDMRRVGYPGADDDEALGAVALLDGHAGELGDDLVVEGVGVIVPVAADAAVVDLEVLDHEFQGEELVSDGARVHRDGVLDGASDGLAQEAVSGGG